MGTGVEDVRPDLERWLKRPFASLFDLILSEYPGYTDQLLLTEVTLGRLRQMRDVILERRQEDHERELLLQETIARALMSTIQGAAGNKKGAKEASRWKLFERRRKRVLPSYERMIAMWDDGAFPDE